MDRLESITFESWPQLRQLFIKDWPNNLLPYYLLDNCIQWRETDPKFIDKNVVVKCLNGDWSDGTFFLFHDNEIFFYTLENGDSDHLKRLLSLIRDRKSYCWTNYTYQRDLKTLDVVLEEINWHKTFIESTKFYHMSCERASLLEIRIPEGLVIHSLSEHDVEYAHSQYPHRDSVHVSFLKLLHKFNKNLGIYNKNDELLAWCFLHQPNAFTALQVHPDHYRKGLASLLLRYFSKSLADDGKDSFAIILDENEASRNLFLKVGFTCIDDVFNIRIEPK